MSRMENCEKSIEFISFCFESVPPNSCVGNLISHTTLLKGGAFER
jgi:hypothetical protein